jgi:hypothetical protein
VEKSPMTLTNRTVVYIQWADTHLSEGGWLDMQSYEDDGECLVDTVGFLIPIGEPGSKDKHVTVWQTICKEEGIHAIHIPVAMVRDMKAIDLNIIPKI